MVHYSFSERAVNTLCQIGPAILHGAITTFLVFFVLIFGRSLSSFFAVSVGVILLMYFLVILADLFSLFSIPYLYLLSFHPRILTPILPFVIVYPFLAHQRTTCSRGALRVVLCPLSVVRRASSTISLNIFCSIWTKLGRNVPLVAMVKKWSFF